MNPQKLYILVFLYLVVPVSASTEVYTHIETSSNGGNSSTHVETNVESENESSMQIEVENNGTEIHKKIDTTINGETQHTETFEPAKPYVATISSVLIPTIQITPQVRKSDLEKSIKTFIHDLLSEIASSLRRP